MRVGELSLIQVGVVTLECPTYIVVFSILIYYNSSFTLSKYWHGDLVITQYYCLILQAVLLIIYCVWAGKWS